MLSVKLEYADCIQSIIYTFRKVQSLISINLSTLNAISYPILYSDYTIYSIYTDYTIYTIYTIYVIIRVLVCGF